MSKITICPHFLIDYRLTTPENILENIIKPLYDFLEESNNKNIQIVLSKEILLTFENSYPWDQSSDPQWAGHLRDWYQLISPSLLKANIINVENVDSLIVNNCAIITSPTIDMFSRFLAVFGTSTMHSGLHEEGIFKSDYCDYPVELQKFCYVVNPYEDLIKIVHPWLRLYNKPLPYEGDYPFVPPENWREFSSPIKGTIRGFLDNKGNNWEWDRMHDNHWDVQHSNTRGRYSNISPDGRILSN